MTKRPLDSESLPTSESKHARQERTLRDLIPPRMLSHMNQYLQDISTIDVSDSALNKIYAIIRGFVGFLEDDLKTLGLSLVTKDAFYTNARIMQKSHFLSLVRAAAAAGASDDDVFALVDSSMFWSLPPTQLTESVVLSVPEDKQKRAVEQSWLADYVDQNPLEGLQLHIATQLDSGMSPKIEMYARYCSIIQSSGMGKSRLLDEFSKRYFMIPINLRGPKDRGFPPGDHKVRDFLTSDSLGIPDSVAMSLIHNFLLALFEQAAETIKGMGSTKLERIRSFRCFMSKGQSMDSTGENRKFFYDKVLDRARKLVDNSRDKDKPDDDSIAMALKNLREVLNTGDPNWSNHRIVATKGGEKFVDIFLAFDEAHTLADSFDLKGQSRFVVLRRKLSLLTSSPLFAFFLSTTGKITSFDRPRGQEASNRLNEGTHASPRPYIYLGFDQLMQGRKVLDRFKTLKEVTSMECIAHMGRPLWGTLYDSGDEEYRRGLLQFAIQKLLCGLPGDHGLSDAQMYALLSQRLALDINTPQYLFNSESPLDAMRTMHEQIANHMRVCVAVGAGIESLRGIASSEPILSEAASRVLLSEPTSWIRALTLVLTGYSINQGDRGELLVASFFAWARDAVIHPKIPRFCSYFSVYELFGALFSQSTFESKILGSLPSLCHTEKERPFKDVFRKAKMHFNHTVKPQVQKLVHRRFLLLNMARGAATLGANCQPGFDAVYPFLYDTLNLDVASVGFIIVQVKNDPTLSYSDLLGLFKGMDPFLCKLLVNLDKDEDHFPIPIIRIVFSLSTSSTGQAKFTHVTYNVPSEGTTTFRNDGRPAFTSYDYICTGIDPSILRPVEVCPDSWSALANKRDTWKDFYDVTVPNVLRSQIPGCGDHEAHFSAWSDAPVHF